MRGVFYSVVANRRHPTYNIYIPGIQVHYRRAGGGGETWDKSERFGEEQGGLWGCEMSKRRRKRETRCCHTWPRDMLAGACSTPLHAQECSSHSQKPVCRRPLGGIQYTSAHNNTTLRKRQHSNSSSTNKNSSDNSSSNNKNSSTGGNSSSINNNSSDGKGTAVLCLLTFAPVASWGFLLSCVRRDGQRRRPLAYRPSSPSCSTWGKRSPPRTLGDLGPRLRMGSTPCSHSHNTNSIYTTRQTQVTKQTAHDLPTQHNTTKKIQQYITSQRNTIVTKKKGSTARRIKLHKNTRGLPSLQTPQPDVIRLPNANRLLSRGIGRKDRTIPQHSPKKVKTR